jgi:class 3 adenylate cyclase
VQPTTKYVSVDGARVAYQVFGDGPPTILVSSGSFSHTDVVWEDPAVALFYERLGSFARVIRYDRLGVSNSDPLPSGWDPNVDTFAREVAAVVDAVGDPEPFVLLAWLDAGPIAIQYVAAHPEQVRGFVLYNTSARFLRSDDYEIGLSEDVLGELLAHVETLWGTEELVGVQVPSRRGDARFASWYGKLVRSLGTPTTIGGTLRHNLGLDVRSVLPAVQVPTLVMHRVDYPLIPIAHSRFLAEHIAGAELVEVPGADGPMYWESPDLILGVLRAFVGRDTEPTRVTQFATILFSDMVRSTEMAGSLGDREWGAVINLHHTIAGEVVASHHGRYVKSTGDGILATFPDPALALAGAVQLREASRRMGIAVRVGMHSGRIETTGDDISGMSVHIAARVLAEASEGEILVSRTVRDLMLGSEHVFASRGSTRLKGVEGSWDLFTLERAPS